MQDPQPVEEAAAQPPPEPPQDAPADESVIEGGVDTIRERLLDFWDGLQSNMLTVGVAIHVVGAEKPSVCFDWKLLYRG